MNIVKSLCVLLVCGALLAQTGCICDSTQPAVVTKSDVKAPPPAPPPAQVVVVNEDLPPDAKPGECWAKVFEPPQFRTETERVCIREASERLEIIPAEYEWVEERVCVKEASTILEEVPARFETVQIAVQTDAGYTGWTVNKDCSPPKDQPTRDVFCLVNHPPQQETVSVTRMAEPPTVKKTVVPAEYETVKRQKLVRPATTRKVTIPAEYDTVEKRVKVSEGRMVWQRVECKQPDAVTLNVDGTLQMRNLATDSGND